MSLKPIDLTGKVFDRLTVLSIHGRDKHGCIKWNCICTCGNKTVSYGHTLKNGKSRSCGCYNRDKMITHGMYGTPEYNTYRSMMERCYNKKNKNYPDYGGRGIIVCKRWINSFTNFLKDMGAKPGPEYSINRVRNNGNYTPSNCKWALPIEQGSNKRNNVLIKTQWGRITVAEAARRSGMNPKIIYQRISRDNWSDSRLLIPPSPCTSI